MSALAPAITRHIEEIREICRRRHVRTLELFGSAATGEFRPGESDYDFLVEFEDGMPPGGHWDAYWGLQEDLVELLGAPVDLVEPRAIRNPYFKRAADESRTSLYAA